MTRRSLFAAIAGMFGVKVAPTTVMLFHGAPTATAALMFSNGARVLGGGATRYRGHHLTLVTAAEHAAEFGGPGVRPRDLERKAMELNASVLTLPLPSHILTATQHREEIMRAALYGYKGGAK